MSFCTLQNLILNWCGAILYFPRWFIWCANFPEMLNYSLSNCHEWTLLPIFSSMLHYEYCLLSHELWTTNNSFWLYIPKKTPKYQLSICKQNYIILSGVELYNTRCSHSAVSFAIYFQKELWNYSSNLVEDICIFFRIRTTKMVPWICYFFFLNIYLGFMSEVCLISFGII